MSAGDIPQPESIWDFIERTAREVEKWPEWRKHPLPSVQPEFSRSEPVKFIECDTCRAKPGSPTLCQGCLNNRQLIGELQETLRSQTANHRREIIAAVASERLQCAEDTCKWCGLGCDAHYDPECNEHYHIPEGVNHECAANQIWLRGRNEKG